MAAVAVLGGMVVATIVTAERAQRATTAQRVGARLPKSFSPVGSDRQVAGTVEQLAAEMGLSLRGPMVARLVAIGSVVVLLAAGLLVGPVGVGGVLLLTAPIAAALRALVRARSRRQFVASLPDALEAMSRAVRSGASLRGAVHESVAVTPRVMAHELALLDRQLELGQPMTAALATWGQRHPAREVQLAVAALSFAVTAGGSQAAVLDGLSQSLRDRQALALEVRALSSQAQMSALVMALLPVGFLALIVAADAEMAAFLFRSPIGLVCLAAGLALDLVGAIWMRRVVQRVIR